MNTRQPGSSCSTRSSRTTVGPVRDLPCSPSLLQGAANPVPPLLPLCPLPPGPLQLPRRNAAPIQLPLSPPPAVSIQPTHAAAPAHPDAAHAPAGAGQLPGAPPVLPLSESDLWYDDAPVRRAAARRAERGGDAESGAPADDDDRRGEVDPPGEQEDQHGRGAGSALDHRQRQPGLRLTRAGQLAGCCCDCLFAPSA